MKKENKNVVAEQTTKRALRHLLSVGLDDIYQGPIFVGHFEQDLLRRNADLQSTVTITAKNAILKNKTTEMAFSPIDILLYPKERFSYRKYSYIDPIDNLKYLSLVLQIANEIELSRPDRNRQIVHSYRFNKTGEKIFSDKFGYGSFREKSKELTKKNIGGYKIITDIADFYDRVNLHRVESTLFGCGCNSEVTSKINSLLLLWSNKDSYGLPVGCDASRILAEAALIDVDRFLLSHKISFIRFVDDFRIFSKSREEASYALSLLTQRLYKEGLNLNAHKTQIIECDTLAQEIETQETLKVTEEAKVEESEDSEREAQQSARAIYAGKIRLRFQSPSEEEREKLRKLNLDELKAKAIFGDDFSSLRDYARAAVIQKNTDSIISLIEISKSYIFMTSYIVDLLIKEGSKLTEEVRKKIRQAFFDWSSSGQQKPEFVQICINRLLCAGDYILDKAHAK